MEGIPTQNTISLLLAADWETDLCFLVLVNHVICIFCLEKKSQTYD